MNRKAYVAYNFNCCIGTDGLLEVTRSHEHCTSMVISRKRCKIETSLLHLSQVKWRRNSNPF